MNNGTRSRLIHFLLAKSIGEAALVAALAVSFYFSVTNKHLHGVLDIVSIETVSGWAVNEADPGERVEVQLYIDDNFIADAKSAEFRPDVHAANRALDDWHGFVFRTPPLSSGEHEARVYAVHRSGNRFRQTLQLIGKPIRFQIAGEAMNREKS
jgi:hypothetical protein